MTLTLSKRQLQLIKNAATAKEERTRLQQAKQQMAQKTKRELEQKRQLVQKNQLQKEKLLTRYIDKDLLQKTKSLSTDRMKATTNPKRTPNVVPSNLNASAQHPQEDDAMSLSPSEYFDDYGAKRRPARKKNPNIWAALYEADAKAQENESKQSMRKRMDHAAETNSFLSKQMDEKRLRRLKQDEEEKKFADQQRKQLQDWKKKQEELEARKNEKNKQEKIKFKALLDEKRRQLEIAKAMKIRAEQKEVDLVKQRLEEDRRKVEDQKQAEARRMENVKKENKKLLEIKKQQKLKIQEEEKKLNAEYKARLERQERQRKEALEATYALQEQKVNLALLEVKSDAEIAREEEERIRRVQEQYEIRENTRLREKDEQRRQRNQDQLRALEVQKEERRQQKLREKEDTMKHVKEWSKEVEQVKIIEQEKAKQAKERNWSNRRLLEKQIKDNQYRKENTDKYGMSELELKMNAPLIRSAKIDHPAAASLAKAGERISRRHN